MWFAFPVGVTHIAVEGQEFTSQGVDAAGRECFNAPAHFAPRILALKGFAAAGEAVVTKPGAVLPKAPDDEEAIAALSKQAEADATEIRGLREDAAKNTATIAALTTERDQLKAALEVASARVAELEDEDEEAPVLKPQPAPAPKK